MSLTPFRQCIEKTMSLIFLCYLVAFGLIYLGKKKPAFVVFALSMTLSLMMFWYHTTSSLNLNF